MTEASRLTSEYFRLTGKIKKYCPMIMNKPTIIFFDQIPKTQLACYVL
jgi:hypothetical protein